ncbi:MAG TPA: orotate phosphoribosyltransferase [Turneriella sp.]|nr:orotate phosphoribosyltransferase [Turneriella sp.]HNE18519.1 orotate phosphoribosyltransferase [Turneriella sp.]HNJ64839.1 orotate phosphoribosyltransferase [Turneriella sp.]HNL10668.1 orotate phosphoribosyltransferase [Turneriella sp.]HNL54973.1 orotate phosphoribosyltransferase [Turneriella sp.]
MTDLASAKATLKDAIRKFSYRENHEQPFTLASGKISPYYFDLKQTLLQPGYLALAGEVVAGIIAQHYQGKVIAAGLTMGADPIIYAACLAHGGAGVDGGQDALQAGDLAGMDGSTTLTNHSLRLIPAIVRKEAKDHGTGKKIEMLKGIDTTTPCVMVDDVITTAGSTLKAFAAMREAGFTVRHAICILDRGEGGREALLSNGVELLPVFTAAEFREK